MHMMATSADLQRILRGLVLVAGEVVRLQTTTVRTTLRHTNAHAADILNKLPQLGPIISAAHYKKAELRANAQLTADASVESVIEPVHPAGDVVNSRLVHVDTPVPAASVHSSNEIWKPTVQEASSASPELLNSTVRRSSAGADAATQLTATRAAVITGEHSVSATRIPSASVAVSADNADVSVRTATPPTAPAAAAAAPSSTSSAVPHETASAPVAPPPPKPKRVFRERAVPASPLARVMGFGSLAANMALGAAGDAVSAVMFGRGAAPAAPTGDGAVNVASAIGMSERQAERLAEGLCRMRGAALKIGQMLSLSDESLLPPAVSRVLERVRAQADVMPRRQLDAVMRAELGPQWRERLGGDGFSDAPVAAASIGQVHRATLPDGRAVAVKVQYPGVADSINSDLNNLATLLTMANFLPKGLYLDSLIAVAREELTAECDYTREAAAQERFRALVGDDADFEVPSVVPELSTRRVLVTTWLDGAPIDGLMDGSASQDTRNRVARKLLRLTLQELFQWRFMQTDPNWGNFFYNPANDRVGLLDFGAAREYRKEFMDDYLRLVWAAANRDRKTIETLSVKLGFLTGYESQVMLDAHVDSGLVVGEPFASNEPFDFKASGITTRVAKHGAVFAEHRLTPPPAEIYSLHRKLAGAFLMCIRLGAVMRCRDLLEDTVSRYDFDAPIPPAAAAPAVPPASAAPPASL